MASKVNLKTNKSKTKRMRPNNKNLYIGLAVLACLAAMGVASLSMASEMGKKKGGAKLPVKEAPHSKTPMYRVKCVVDEHTAKGGVGIFTHAYFKGEIDLKKKSFLTSNFFDLKQVRTTGVAIAGVSQLADRLYVSADQQMDFLQLDLHMGGENAANSSIIRSSSDFSGMANLIFEQEKNGDKVVFSATCKILKPRKSTKTSNVQGTELVPPKKASQKANQDEEGAQKSFPNSGPEDVLPPRSE